MPQGARYKIIKVPCHSYFITFVVISEVYYGLCNIFCGEKALVTLFQAILAWDCGDCRKAQLDLRPFSLIFNELSCSTLIG